MKQSIIHPSNLFCMFIAVLLSAFDVNHASADDFYVIAGSPGVGTEIKSLPYTISVPGFYYIKKDLSCAAGTHGITITADNVTLDLMGFSLVGPGGVGDYSGIFMDTRDNVEIRNGTVRNFMENGIVNWETDGKGLRIINIRAKDNGVNGIASGGKDNIVKNCTATGNKAYGIQTSAGSTVTGNICFDNSTFGIAAGFGSTITGNTCHANGSIGIMAGQGSTITGNTCYDNTDRGISAFGSTITGNTCYSNEEGIYAGSGSTVVGNTCRYNTNLGINLAGDNLVDQNTATDNGTNRNSCATCTFGTNHTPQ